MLCGLSAVSVPGHASGASASAGHHRPGGRHHQEHIVRSLRLGPAHVLQQGQDNIVTHSTRELARQRSASLTLTVSPSRIVRLSNQIPSKTGAPLTPGSILGHEAMGIVDKVGPEVKNLKVGDRVVISAPISCGQCEYCKRGQYSLCATSNPSEATELMYGHRMGGLCTTLTTPANLLLQWDKTMLRSLDCLSSAAHR